MNITKEIQLTLEETKDYYVAANRSRHTLLIVIDTIGMVVTLLINKSIGLPYTAMLEILGLLITFLFYIIFSSVRNRHLAQKRYITNDSFRSAGTITFMDEDLLIHRKDDYLKISYPSFYRYVEFDDFFSLFIKRKRAIVIPKRCMEMYEINELHDILLNTGKLYESRFYNLFRVKLRK